MPNTYKNKVVYGNRTLIDLTSDTVTKPEHVLYGRKFHTASGWQTRGEAEPPLNDVNFYDFTGTRLYSYTAEEAQALTEMPTAPDFYNFDQNGINRRRRYNQYASLTADGWNYTLEQMNAQLSVNNRCDIGGLYIPENPYGQNKSTYIYCTGLSSLSNATNRVYITLCVNGTVRVSFSDGYNTIYDGEITGNSLTTPITTFFDIEWGDIYPSTDIIISIFPYEYNNTQYKFCGSQSVGSLLLHSNTASQAQNITYQSLIRAIELGSCIAGIDDYAFKNLFNLETITFPSYLNNWSSGSTAGQAIETFANCINLKYVGLPYGITSAKCFQNCTNLKTASLPPSIVDCGDFSDSGIERIVIPSSSLTSFEANFSNCKNLKEDIYIRCQLPSIDGINNVNFSNCISLKGIQLSWSVEDWAPIPIPINVNYYNCSSLKYIHFEDDWLGSIGANACKNCRSLADVELTYYSHLESIGDSCFEGCSSMRCLVLGSAILNIGSKAFKDCYGLKTIVLDATTPPTIQSDTFENLSSDCIIYVPDGCLSAYTSAPYWSLLASQIQEGYPFVG